MRQVYLSLIVFIVFSINARSQQDTLLSENFENNPPNGWVIKQNFNSHGWEFGSNIYDPSSWYIPAHTNYAVSNDDKYSCDLGPGGSDTCNYSKDTLVSPIINLHNADNPKLSFDYFYNSAYQYSEASLLISTDNGLSWVHYFDLTPQSQPTFNWASIEISLSPFINQNINIAFLHFDNNQAATGFAIDNVIVTKNILAIVSLPVYEDFNSGEITNGWSERHPLKSAGWEVVDTLGISSPGWTIPQQQPLHTPFVVTNDDFYSCPDMITGLDSCNYPDDYLISPLIDLSGIDIINLGFKYYFTDPYNISTADVLISSDSGNTWINFYSLQPSNNPYFWEELNLELNSFSYQTIRIAFHSTDNGYSGTGFAIDDIEITGIALPTYTLPFIEDFEGNVLLNGWMFQSDINSHGFEITNSVGLNSTSWTIPPQTPVQTNYAISNDDVYGCDLIPNPDTCNYANDYLISPYIDFSNLDYVNLSFDSYFTDPYNESEAFVLISTNSGLSWDTILSLSPQQNPYNWELLNINLSNFTQNIVQIAFYCKDNGGWGTGFAIDNINIVGGTAPTFTLPYSEDFEGTPFINGWKLKTPISGSAGWLMDTVGTASWTIPSHSTFMVSNDDKYGCDSSGMDPCNNPDDYLISPYLNFYGYSNILLTFSSYFTDPYNITSGFLFISDDGGVSWDTLLNMQTQSNINTWQINNIDLSLYIDKIVRIAFYCTDNGQWGTGFAVDDIQISGSPIPTYGLPFIEDFESNPFADGWTYSHPGNSAGWEFDTLGTTSSSWTIPSHTMFAVSNDAIHGCLSGIDTCNVTDDYLYTPFIDLAGSQDPVLSFDSYYTSPYQISHAEVLITSDSGQTWQSLILISPQSDIYNWENIEIDLAAFQGQKIRMAFHSYDLSGTETGTGFAIDNVIVHERIQVSGISSNISCFGENDGSIEISILGGIAPFGIIWSNGGTSSIISTLIAGNYSVTVNDSYGNTDTASFIIVEPTSLSVFENVVNQTGIANGSIDITVSGGTSPYEFSWSNVSTNEDLIGINAGVYGLTIYDNNNCTLIDSIEVLNLNTAPVVSDIPNQTINQGDDFVLFNLDSFVIDDYTSDANIIWSVSGDVNLFVGIVNNIVEIEPIDTTWLGSETIYFTATDELGLFSSDSAIFTIEQTIFTQSIQLTQGWNIFSLYVEPTDINMLSIISQVTAGNHLLKLQDEAGSAIIPFFGSWLNGVGNWEVTEGYKIKVDTGLTIDIVGPLVSFPVSIPLQTGWNIISYPYSYPQDGEIVLDQLITNGTLIQAQSQDGSAIIPVGPFVINTINDFMPGQGYKVKVNAPDTLNFNLNSSKTIINSFSIDDNSETK